jgi:hypothetical protein
MNTTPEGPEGSHTALLLQFVLCNRFDYWTTATRTGSARATPAGVDVFACVLPGVSSA